MARRRLDRTIGLVGCLLAVLIAAAPVSAQQATCQKSRFGADDQVGSFFGAWMGGLVFDRFGSYDFAWGALIVIGLAAFTLQWLMDERPPAERKGAGAPAAMPA